eukprot:362153-Prymnesium_polylepis.1
MQSRSSGAARCTARHSTRPDSPRRADRAPAACTVEAEAGWAVVVRMEWEAASGQAYVARLRLQQRPRLRTHRGTWDRWQRRRGQGGRGPLPSCLQNRRSAARSRW